MSDTRMRAVTTGPDRPAFDAARPWVSAGPLHVAVVHLLIAAVLAVLAAVWIFEWLGYAPCELCLIQRRPYYVALPFLILAVPAMAAAWPDCAARGALAIAGLCFAATALLGAYHAGVEWGWFAAPATCGAGITGSAGDAGSLLADLAASTPPKCDEAAGRFLGLSFAGWNVVFAVPLAWIALRTAARRQEPTQRRPALHGSSGVSQ